MPWELSIQVAADRLVFTSFLYEELRAIQTACRRLHLGRGLRERLFAGNGKRLLAGLGRSPKG